MNNKNLNTNDKISEKEFLNSYSIEEYERPSVAADIVVFTMLSKTEDSYRHDPKNSLSVLLIRRGEHPFKNCWAIPGGFMRGNETIEECAYREITEETGITPTALMNIGVFSEPCRDPRGRVVSNAFLSITGDENLKPEGSTDAVEARWFDVSFDNNSYGEIVLELSNCSENINVTLKEKLTRFGKTEYEIIDNDSLAFDHAKIIATALTVLKKSAEDFELIFDFLPEKFTLTELQKVQETIMNISVLPANFRRKIANLVEETDEYTSGAGHRPAKLFRRK